nr:uncharacterized protein LOC109173786 [Ipomoea batatas]
MEDFSSGSSQAGAESSLIEELGVGLLLELAEVGVALPDDATCFGRKAKDSEQVFTKRELQKVDMDLMLVTLCEEEIPTKEYEYEIFRSPEEYQEVNLEPPRYDLAEKYTPQRAAVTVAVGPPLPEAGTMRSFPVSARPPAPATKISLGSKKAEPSKPADPNSDASVPTGLPLTTMRPASLGGEHDAARATKRGKEKEIVEVEEVATVKRPHRDGSGSTTPVIDVPMKHGDEPPAALLSRIYVATPPPEKTSGWSTALVGERIACDLIQMAHSVTDLFSRAKDGDEIYRREVVRLMKSLAKREQQIKELEGKLRTAEETGRRILEHADLGEKILTDPGLAGPAHLLRARDRRGSSRRYLADSDRGGPDV